MLQTPWCYKMEWDGLDGSSGGVRYGAPYSANNKAVGLLCITQGGSISAGGSFGK